MRKKAAIAVLTVLFLALASVSLMLYFRVKKMDGEALELSARAAALENDNMLMKTENDRLLEALSSAYQEIEDGQEPPKEDTLAEKVFAANPIDGFFSEMADKLELLTTVDMAMFSYIYCAAWEAEMMNCYEILSGRTSVEYALKILEEERNSYIEYINSKTDIDILIELSGVFDGAEDLWVGTLSQILRPNLIAEGYSKKTLEMFGRLEGIGETPMFIFSEEEYAERLKRELPDLWEKAFE